MSGDVSTAPSRLSARGHKAHGEMISLCVHGGLWGSIQTIGKPAFSLSVKCFLRESRGLVVDTLLLARAY